MIEGEASKDLQVRITELFDLLDGIYYLLRQSDLSFSKSEELDKLNETYDKLSSTTYLASTSPVETVTQLENLLTEFKSLALKRGIQEKNLADPQLKGYHQMFEAESAASDRELSYDDSPEDRILKAIFRDDLKSKH